MKPKIGIVGSSGDLGSQVLSLVKATGLEAVTSDLKDSTGYSIEQVFAEADIIHLCIPVRYLTSVPSVKEGSIIVLHDSVMQSSQHFNEHFLNNKGSIVHMLMNDTSTVVVAEGTPSQSELIAHLQSLGLNPKTLPIDQHDLLMAKSQAPLALLSQVLLPYLYEQSDAGMLTESGRVLKDTLHSRALVWTPETITSILANPQLQKLVNEMQQIVDTAEQK